MWPFFPLSFLLQFLHCAEDGSICTIRYTHQTILSVRIRFPSVYGCNHNSSQKLEEKMPLK